MLNELFGSVTNAGANISLTSAVSTIVVAFVLGMLISWTYICTSDSGGYSQSFSLTLIIVPIVAAIIILMVGSNLAAAFSVGGAFSLVRFRSEPGSPKNIAYLFFTMAAGLACGVQCYIYALIFTVFLCLIMFLLTRIDFGMRKSNNKILKIMIPENLDYKGVFEDILNKYTMKYTLSKVKTVDLGSLYELDYNIVTSNSINDKEFIDELRCRNGNLSITLVLDSNTGEF